MTNDTPPLFKLCRIAGCAGDLCARGLCRKHYNVERRTGDPLQTRIDEVSLNCVVCGAVFKKARKSNTVMCRDPECHHAAWLAATSRYRATHPKPGVPSTGDVPCRHCGQVFAANGRNFVYCSKACMKRDRGKVRIKRNRMMKDAGWESFNSREIFIRDAWVCQLCGEPIDPKLTIPDVMRASIDHITPVSKGGAHLRSNVQAAHLRCNISKGNRVSVL